MFLHYLNITSSFVLLAVFFSQPALASINEAIVKIYTVSNPSSYHNPWQKKGQKLFHGSGAIIEGNRILTNAHVVADNMFIQVRRAGAANKYHAEIEAIDYESDLALLSVEEKEFFKDAQPLALGTSLAKVRDKVAVYGFPEGGDKLSITEGVVSRIDHIEYAYSGARLLTCQIDAPINAGNSGGPVIYDNKITGVAFQGMGGAYENIGYMIPTPIVRHFLTDLQDNKKIDGFPTLGVLMQKLENPDMRRYYKLKGRNYGVLVNKIYAHSPAKGILQPGDIILKINGVKISSDGTIEFRKGQRTFFGYITQQKQIGDSLILNILRNGFEQNVNIVMDVPQEANRLVPLEHEQKPRYYIYGGLVFEPLTLNYLQEFGNDGKDWPSNAPVAMLNYYLNGEKKSPFREIVFLSKVLADESNVGFHDFANAIITEVNGVKIHSFHHLIKMIQKSKEDFILFKTARGLEITLHQKTIKKRINHILKKYQISSQSSES